MSTPKRQPVRKSPPSQALEPLLTLNDAAAYLKLHPRTVRTLLRLGELRGHVICGRWRLTREDVVKFVQDAPIQWDFTGTGESVK